MKLEFLRWTRPKVNCQVIRRNALSLAKLFPTDLLPEQAKEFKDEITYTQDAASMLLVPTLIVNLTNTIAKKTDEENSLLKSSLNKGLPGQVISFLASNREAYAAQLNG